MSEFSPRSFLREHGPRAVEIRDKRSSDKRRSRQKTRHTSERPSFRLDIINQPAKGVPLGIEVSTSVLVSLVFSSPDAVPRKLSIDTNRLVCLASLVAETSHGCIQMENDTMVGQQLVDSLRPIPEAFAEKISQNHPCRVTLGYFAFSELLLRQSGYFRLRLSLVQIPLETGMQSPATITAVDSELIKVERRAVHTRYQQRI